jgi:hypothetical protein
LLDDDQVERYARQIVVPGIGAAGQEKLLHSTVLVVGHPRGCATAALYLRAAGVTVSAQAGDADLVVVCDRSVIDESELSAMADLGKPVCWYVIESDGVACGVHPGESLPPPRPPASGNDGIHDAAACEAAALACAVLTGLLQRQ